MPADAGRVKLLCITALLELEEGGEEKGREAGDLFVRRAQSNG